MSDLALLSRNPVIKVPKVPQKKDESKGKIVSVFTKFIVSKKASEAEALQKSNYPVI